MYIIYSKVKPHIREVTTEKPENFECIGKIEENLVVEFSTVGTNSAEDELSCVEWDLLDDSEDHVYILQSHESGEGQSYHEITSLYIYKSEEEAIENVADYYECEHSHPDSCPPDEDGCLE